MERKFFYLNEVQEMTGFSRQTLYNEMWRGKLIFRKAASRTVVFKEDLDAWMRGFAVVQSPAHHAA